ncbi:MAG: response regulator [Methanocellales archaeon]
MDKKIMIVEDDEELRELYKDMLEERYSIIPVGSGRQCLEKLRFEKPDVILLDILMPDIDGWQVLEEIKRSNCEIPVIILTALTPGANVLDKGIAGYLTKPVSKQILMRAIESAFKLRDFMREYEAALNSQRRELIEGYENKIQHLKKLLITSKLQLELSPM